MRRPEMEIRPDSLYRFDEFKKLAGLGDSAMRAAREQGLPVRRIHGRSWIRGRDFIEHVFEHGVDPTPKKEN
jgi:hypothetical protein